MTAKGHVVLAITPIVSLWTGGYISEPLIFPLVAIGALLPDIDEPGSYIGRKSIFISGILKDIGLEHRGITHFFILPLFIMLVSYIFFDGGFLFWLGFGILMHDVGDMLTKGGIISFFYPFLEGRKIVLLPYAFRFKTFSLHEKIVIIGLIVVNAWMIGDSYALFT